MNTQERRAFLIDMIAEGESLKKEGLALIEKHPDDAPMIRAYIEIGEPMLAHMRAELAKMNQEATHA